MEYYQRSMVYDGQQWFAAGGRKNISRIRWNSKLFCSFLKAIKNEKTLPRINSLGRFIAMLYRLMGCFRDRLIFSKSCGCSARSDRDSRPGGVASPRYLRDSLRAIFTNCMPPIYCASILRSNYIL